MLETSGVVHIVSVANSPLPLTEEEILRLKVCTAKPAEVEPHPYLKIGHRVRVKDGPFGGWEGILVSKQNASRLVVTLDHIMKSVAVNLHGADVEAIG